MDKRKKNETKDEPKDEKNKKEIDLQDQKNPLNVIEASYEDRSIHNEMAELFEEDEVTHQHGGTDIEAD